jgi:uncharacterized protein (TIGR02271 family)
LVRRPEAIFMTDQSIHNPEHAPSLDAVSMIRSEERLRTSIRTVPVERVRMKKIIVTEEKTITVTVRREELRLTRDLIESGTSDLDLSVERTPDESHSMVLYKEQITVTSTIVPVERVTLMKETFTEEQIVTGSVRKEQVDIENHVGM